MSLLKTNRKIENLKAKLWNHKTRKLCAPYILLITECKINSSNFTNIISPRLSVFKKVVGRQKIKWMFRGSISYTASFRQNLSFIFHIISQGITPLLVFLVLFLIFIVSTKPDGSKRGLSYYSLKASHNSKPHLIVFCFTVNYRNKENFNNLTNMIIKYMDFSCLDAMKSLRQT